MRLAVAGLILGSLAGSAFGQSVVSVNSGVVHYVDGSAFIQDKAVELKFGQFPSLKANETLRTAEGRAEILLVPGTILRLGENSAIRMIGTRLSDTKLELVEGEILIEAVDGNKDSAAAQTKGNLVTVLAKGSTITFPKPGLYSFTSEPARLRVYEGEAIVTGASGQLTLKKGKETLLGGMLMAVKFDTKIGDELIRWSSRRSGDLATANVAAARSLSSSGGMWSSYLGGGGSGGWNFNPMFGMYTYVPYGGIAYSPFGYSYWSPYAFSQYYLPYYNYNRYNNYGGGNGGGGAIRNSGGNSATAAAHAERAVVSHGGSSGFATSTASMPVGNSGMARGGYSGADASPSSGGNSGGGGVRSAGGNSGAASVGAPSTSSGSVRGR